MVGITADECQGNLSSSYSYLKSLGAPDLSMDSKFTIFSKLAFVIQLGSPNKSIFRVGYPGDQHLTLNVTLYGK